MVHATAKPSHPKDAAQGHQTPAPKARQVSTLSTGLPLIHPKAGCACGGGCPRCQAKNTTQTKLKISDPGDQYEREADQIAQQVLHSDPGKSPQNSQESPLLHSEKLPPEGIQTAYRQAMKEEEDEDIQLKQREINSATVSTNLAASVTAQSGRPLSAAERAYFEPRFGQNFSSVRIHDESRAHAAAKAIHARAFTLGNHIAFGVSEYRPESFDSRLLLAHELVHTLQQRSGIQPQLIQRRQIQVRGRTFEIGDAKVANRDAKRDILRQGVLFPGSDQRHILVSGDDRLGYEVSHTDPEDPFRWSKFKDIVDNGKIDIKAVSLTDTIPTLLVHNGQSRQQDISLISLGGSGITLVRESLLRQISPNEPTITASNDPNRDKIFYVPRGSGQGALSSNSLAHELFGHYWLALQGVPFLHPPSRQDLLRQIQQGRNISGEAFRNALGRHQRLGVLTEAHGIRGPFGHVFEGTVRDYIDRLVGAETGRVESPTRRVSNEHLMAELQALYDELQKPGGLVLQADGRGVISADVARHWSFVANSYEILRHIPAGPPGSSFSAGMLSEGVRNLIVEWYRDILSEDQQRAFRNILGAAGSRFRSGMPPNLARDVLAEINRHER